MQVDAFFRPTYSHKHSRVRTSTLGYQCIAYTSSVRQLYLDVSNPAVLLLQWVFFMHPMPTVLPPSHLSLDVGWVLSLGTASFTYVPCSATSWQGMMLEWCGPFSSLEECVVSCQSYYEMGGREGAEKVAMRRDLLDLLL